jgi:hypothetical protein
MSLPRNRGKQRAPGHLKNLFCCNCQCQRNHVEIRPNCRYTKEDFDLEFELGRYVDGNITPIGQLPLCKEDCPYNVNGRCWNTNHSYDCDKRKEDSND